MRLNFFPVKCNDTENPTNGSTFMSTDGMTTYKVFNCDAGSTLNGSTVIYCNTDGSWNMAAPTCSKMHCFIDILETIYNNPSVQPFPVFSQIHVYC